MATNDVQADRHAIGRKTTGDAGRWMANHVDGEGEGQVATEGVHRTPRNGLGLLVDRESRHGHGRSEEQVVSLHKRREPGPELVYGQQGTGVISARDPCSMLEALTSVGRQLVGLLLQQMPISSIGIGAKNAPEGRDATAKLWFSNRRLIDKTKIH